MVAQPLSEVPYLKGERSRPAHKRGLPIITLPSLVPVDGDVQGVVRPLAAAPPKPAVTALLPEDALS